MDRAKGHISQDPYTNWSEIISPIDITLTDTDQFVVHTRRFYAMRILRRLHYEGCASNLYFVTRRRGTCCQMSTQWSILSTVHLPVFSIHRSFPSLRNVPTAIERWFTVSLS